MAFQAFTPIQYLMIDIANNYGIDKEDWDFRLDWFALNQEQIEDLIKVYQETPRKVAKHPLMMAAESPALFFAGIMAYDKARRGEAIGYPISLDATASGAQILAVLIGCEKSARLCNVVDTGHREDLYTNIFNLMCKRLADAGGISRPDAKAAVMTSLYGSKATPRRIFGEGEKLDVFYETMEEEATGVWELNQALLELWNPHAYSHDWVLPDNFHVKTKTMDLQVESFTFLGERHEVISKVNRPTAEGLSIGANVTHSIDGMIVREISRRCSYDAGKILELMQLLSRPVVTRIIGETSPNEELVKTLWEHYQESGFLSARILEALDEQNIYLVDRDVIREMLLSMPEAPFPVISNHDCFRVHPNHGNDLRRQYNRILSDLAKSDVLSFIASQIAGEKINAAKFSDISSKILEANYALS